MCSLADGSAAGGAFDPEQASAQQIVDQAKGVQDDSMQSLGRSKRIIAQAEQVHSLALFLAGRLLTPVMTLCNIGGHGDCREAQGPDGADEAHLRTGRQH